MVKCLNLDTKNFVYIHLNDLKDFKRPDTRERKISDCEIKRIYADQDLEIGNLSKGNINRPRRNREILV